MLGTEVGSRLSGVEGFTGKEVKDRLIDTGISSAMSFGLLEAPGAVRNIRYTQNQNKKQSVQNVFNLSKEVNDYIEKAAQKESGLKDFIKFADVDSTENLDTIIDKDLTGYSHVIRQNDVRHFLSNPENTVEDIKKYRIL